MRLENCRERDKKARSTREASSRIILYRRDINSGGEKTNVVIPFCRPFPFIQNFIFYDDIFHDIFTKQRGEGKARRPFIDNDGARRRKGESRVVERRRRERRANRNEKWRCRFRSRPLLSRGFPGCGAAESLDPSLVKSR